MGLCALAASSSFNFTSFFLYSTSKRHQKRPITKKSITPHPPRTTINFNHVQWQPVPTLEPAKQTGCKCRFLYSFCIVWAISLLCVVSYSTDSLHIKSSCRCFCWSHTKRIKMQKIQFHRQIEIKNIKIEAMESLFKKKAGLGHSAWK